MNIIILLQLIFGILMLLTYTIGGIISALKKDFDLWLKIYLIGAIFYSISTLFWILGKV